MKNKKFDCIEVVREIRDRHFDHNKGKSRKEIIARFRQKASTSVTVKENPAPHGTAKQ